MSDSEDSQYSFAPYFSAPESVSQFDNGFRPRRGAEGMDELLEMGGRSCTPEAVIDRAYDRYVRRLPVVPRPPVPRPRNLPSAVGVDVGVGQGNSRRVITPVPNRPLHSTAFPECKTDEEEAGLFRPTNPLPSIYQHQSTAQDGSIKNSQETTEQLLKSLVDQFTTVVQNVQSGSSVANSHAMRLKPPRYDGHSDVQLFIEQFQQIADLSGWDEKMTLVQLRGCLDKNAKDCSRASTVKGVYSKLLHMFGLSSSEARERLHGLRQEPDESYVKLGIRVERLTKLAYGGLGEEVEIQMALEHFDRALSDSTLRQHLLGIRPKNLEAAVRAAEKYALVSRQPYKFKHKEPYKIAQVNTDVAGSSKVTSQSTNKSVEILLETLTEKLDVQARLIKEQNSRISNLERTQGKSQCSSQSNDADNKPKVCYYCKDPSHFKRECPKLAAKAERAKQNEQPVTSSSTENL